MRQLQAFTESDFRRNSIRVTNLRRLMTIALGFLLAGVMYAAENKCTMPVIETSTGDEDVCPGVSTVTITASEGELISYTTDGSTPPANLGVAVAGPVKFAVMSAMDEVRAIALKDGQEPSAEAVKYLYPIAVSKHKTFSQMFLAKDKGCLAGPYLVYAIEPLKTVTGSWILLCEPTIRESVNCIVVEYTGNFKSAYPDIHVGELVDYVVVNTYDEQSNASRGGMKRVTKFDLPSRSVPSPTPQPELLHIDAAPSQEEDMMDYFRMPVILDDVQVVDGLVYGLTVTDKFGNVSMDFNEEDRYNLRGFVGTDAADGHAALRFFVLGYETVEAEPDVAGSVAEAFDFEGESRTVILACDLTVVATNRERNCLFVCDAQGDDMVMTGDFTAAELYSGDIVKGVVAMLTTTDGVLYGAVEGSALVSTGRGAEAFPIDISADELADYTGRHIQFYSALERTATLSSRAGETPELRVGGIRLNPSAISDLTAERIGYAVNSYDENEQFKLRGFVMPDGVGNKEFWPIEILTKNGGAVSADIDVEIGGEVKIVNGRPALTDGQEMHDLLGRPVDPASASSGVYIIHTPNRTAKICLP